MTPASWVVVDKATGAALFETWSAALVAKLNTAKYEAVPILEYLVALNHRIKEGDGSTNGD